MSVESTAVARVRSVIERLVRDGTAIARQDGSHHQIFPVSIPPREGEALRRWVRRENATHTIEIGLAYGISALYICQGLLSNGSASARHVTIDPYQTKPRFASCGLQFLDEAGCMPLIEYYAEESQVVLPRLLSEGRSFDFAFVDGNHRFDAVFVDLYYLGRLLRRGGVVIVDDYQLPGIARAAAFFVANLGWRVEEVSEPHDLHQWAVLRTSLLKDSRPYEYFADF